MVDQIHATCRVPGKDALDDLEHVDAFLEACNATVTIDRVKKARSSAARNERKRKAKQRDEDAASSLVPDEATLEAARLQNNKRKANKMCAMPKSRNCMQLPERF